jgi:hypothetical protein
MNLYHLPFFDLVQAMTSLAAPRYAAETRAAERRDAPRKRG